MIDDIYHNFWGKQKPKFTAMELALMEGGHCLETSNEKTNNNTSSTNTNRMQFIAELHSKSLGRQSGKSNN